MLFAEDSATVDADGQKVVAAAVSSLKQNGVHLGEQNPVADNSTDAGRQQNRRAVIAATG